jgi:aspartyl aminopeptidase
MTDSPATASHSSSAADPGDLNDPGDLGDLMSYLDASRSPWHAVQSAVERLQAAGFEQLAITDDWSDRGEGLPAAGYVISGASLVAYRQAGDVGAGGATPFRIVGAHTDSPCLKVKPRPDTGGLGWKQLAVEVYGGVLLNSWLDRDLGIAGRVVTIDGGLIDITVDEPICRVPQLAIHLDRDVNDRGLVLDKQQHMTPVWGTGAPRDGEFRDWLAQHAAVAAAEIAGWDLCLFDCSSAAVLGSDSSLLASGRLDNQLSCWAAVDALCAGAAAPGHHTVVALFDHEEVGSESSTGAAGPMLEHVLERLTAATGGSRSAHLAALAGSSCLSTDNAHAVHPNYPERHEPGHRPIVNHGPAIKVNANQRYATTAQSALAFQLACERADVPWQVFVSRNNMPCGSTIGPITATRLGIETVDVGVPQLSMHSARELCGVQDAVWLATADRSWLAG